MKNKIMCKGIFSDLDKTLIFSDRFMNRHIHYVPESMEIVDSFLDKEGNRHYGYMNRKLLEFLLKQELFVPVTARSIRRYRDVAVLSNNTKYAITSCGGYLLVDNEIDREYRESLNVDIERLYYMANKVAGKVVDDSYITTEFMNWYIIKDYIQDYKCEVDGFGTMTIMPKNVGKDRAVRYLIDRLGVDDITCCGDSQHDVQMLSLANKSVIPSTSVLSVGNTRHKVYSAISDEMINLV